MKIIIFLPAFTSTIDDNNNAFFTFCKLWLVCINAKMYIKVQDCRKIKNLFVVSVVRNIETNQYSSNRNQQTSMSNEIMNLLFFII